MSILESNNDGSIKEEIIDLAKILADSQTRLQQIVIRLEDREQSSEGLEARYEELQKKYNEAVNGAKWLSTQNVHLQDRLAQYQPEFDRVLSAREGAFKKLKHARKVIRDLLQERGDMSSPRSQGSLTQEEIDQALGDDPQRDDPSSSSSSSSGRSAGVGSDRTVRLTTRPSSSANVSSPLPSPRHTARQSPTDSAKGSPPWQIHFKKPPGSAVLLEGPITWERLQSSLGLTDDTMLSLENLMTSPDISMRVHITRLPTDANVAFLYDPILIDTRQQSYVCDWGRQHINQNIERYILRHKAIDPIFHVFTFPVKEKNWYYIGQMNWYIAELKNFWPLEGNSRTKIINKLCRRSRGEVEATEMTKLLDELELKQFCVELKGVTDPKISHEFARDVLGLQTTPSDSEGQ